ncbi:PIG-L family deacetylase [Nocardioides sp. P5_C9_2]
MSIPPSGPGFRHDEAGTPASVWTRALAEHPLTEMDLSTVDRLVVVGAHPDDETLGAGGLVHLAGRAGWEVLVVSATAGEGSHPSSPTHDPVSLADLRRGELERAVARLAGAARIRCLDLPDGSVAEHEDTLVAELVAAVGLAGDRTLLAAPWRHDGHPDHEAVGRAAAVAARRTDARLVEYPVWMWHWGTAETLPWAEARAVRLDDTARAGKRSAVAAHASQVAPLSAEPGDEVLLGPALLAHFDRDVEVLIEVPEPAPDDALDRVHRDRDDPWDVDGWYERRKRAITLASLPRERYDRVLEVGCSVGALAVDLAGRCDALVALDSSAAAVEAARERLAGSDHVDVRRADLPAQWPEGRFDLVSVSEVGYFLSPSALGELVSRALGALEEDGHLLLCHWRHDLVGWPLTGPRVHEVFLATGARVLAEHQDPDFVLHVLRATP